MSRAALTSVRLLASVLVVLSLDAAQAQINNVTNDTITPIEGVGHDYIKMMSETVNPANGGLDIKIALPVAKSRGLTVPFSITYDSNQVHHLNQGVYNSWGSVGWYANSSLLGQGGWNFALPYAHVTSWNATVSVLTGYGQGGNPIYSVYTCGNVGSYVMQDLSGVTHSLGISARVGLTDPANYCGAFSSSPASDGKAEGFIGAPGGSQFYLPSITANDDVGTVYKFSTFKPDTHSTDPNSYAALPDTIEDRNGNIATLAINASNAVTVTDSSGRTSISTSGFGPSGSTNTVTVSAETYQVTWRTVSANFSTQFVWAGFPNDPDPNYDICIPPGSASDSQTVISQITLPNGTFYKFYYGNDATPHGAPTNPYGVVSEIDYPSGAWATYSWKLSDTLNELVSYPGVYYQNCNVCSDCTGGPSGCPAPVTDGCRYQYKSPVVAARQVSFGASSPSLTQTFSYSTSWSSSQPIGWTNKTTTVTTTDNTTGKSATTTYSYKSISPVSFPGGVGGTAVPGQIAVEQSETYSDWNGSPLRTVTKDWLDPVDMILDQAAVYPSGLSSKKTYSYVTNNGFFREPQEVDEFDFSASSPTRKTITAYQQFMGTPGVITGRPCKVVTYDSSGKPASETDSLYDGGSVVCGSPGVPSVTSAGGVSLTGHDATTFSAGSTVSRGNVTGRVRRLFGGQSPMTKYTYDETGQVTSTTDPNGNTTQYSYADAFLSTNTGSFNTTGGSPAGGTVTNAYLTRVTHPMVNGITLTESYTYGYNNGELTTATDANQQVTTYRYDDFFSRPTEVDLPDQGKTILAYNDTPPSPTVTTTKQINAVTTMQSIAVMDGMGHNIQNQLTTDPDGATTTDLAYTGLGQVLSRSNPHRSGTSVTDGTTSYLYDGIGRTCLVIPPGGTAATTCPTTFQAGDSLTTYTDNCTTVTDAAGKARKSCADALGRLTNVWEDPAGLNYETDYQYDALDNLLNVTQKGGSTQANWRVRSFAYDSLSRLLSATNPESGTILYGYDLNGNVISKKDARGIQTTMQYDALNRPLSKTYSDGTPTATFYYDTPPAPWASTEQNTKGRLVEETTGITPEP